MEGIARLVADIAERAPGASVLDVFRALTASVIDDAVAGGDEDLLAVARIIRDNRALRERLTLGWESASGAADGDLVPGIVARTLWFTHRSIFLAALHGLLDEEDRGQLAQRLRVAAGRAYDQLAAGLGDYGASPRPAEAAAGPQ